MVLPIFHPDLVINVAKVKIVIVWKILYKLELVSIIYQPLIVRDGQTLSQAIRAPFSDTGSLL